MAYKSLLLHLEEGQNTPKNWGAVINLAQRFQANVTGLVFSIEQFPAVYPINHAATTAVIETLAEENKRNLEMANTLAESFRKFADQAGQRVECRVEECYLTDCADIVNLHGRFSDLICIAQPESSSVSSWRRNLSEYVLLASGMPVLVLPKDGAELQIGKRVTVAWDGEREAARAIHDALPLLSHADAVDLLILNAEESRLGFGSDPGVDMAKFLALHGCNVDLRSFHSSESDIGQAILQYSSDFGADLLVMGAYGHARVLEIMLGGATKTILQEAKLPVLLSH